MVKFYKKFIYSQFYSFKCSHYLHLVNIETDEPRIMEVSITVLYMEGIKCLQRNTRNSEVFTVVHKSCKKINTYVDCCLMYCCGCIL